jgi:ribosomal protein S18 acetylase RimI-like enzyme
MTIRVATRDETQRILNYHMEVVKEATMGFVKPSQAKVSEFMAPFINGGGYYLVHSKNNSIQGWIGVGRMIDQNTDEWVGFINEMYVLPPFRNQGVAEKLCKAAFNQLKIQGFTKVHLNVYGGNPARRLYQKLGFKDVSTLMAKNLDLSEN